MVVIDTAPLPPSPAPEARAGGPLDARAIMAENDRVIAKNNRAVAAITARQQAEPAKFDRVKADCEGRLGVASNAASAKGIYRCIEAAW